MMAHDAVSALVNLSDNLAVARHLVDPEYLVWLVSYTAVGHFTPSVDLADLLRMLPLHCHL